MKTDKLTEKIKTTLDEYQEEEPGFSISRGFDVLRWAKSGLLAPKTQYLYGMENQYGELMGVFNSEKEAVSRCEEWAGDRLTYYRVWRRPVNEITGITHPSRQDFIYERGEKH